MFEAFHDRGRGWRDKAARLRGWLPREFAGDSGVVARDGGERGCVAIGGNMLPAEADVVPGPVGAGVEAGVVALENGAVG